MPTVTVNTERVPCSFVFVQAGVPVSMLPCLSHAGSMAPAAPVAELDEDGRTALQLLAAGAAASLLPAPAVGWLLPVGRGRLLARHGLALRVFAGAPGCCDAAAVEAAAAALETLVEWVTPDSANHDAAVLAVGALV